MMHEKGPSYYNELRQKEWKDTAGFGPSARTRYRILKSVIKKYADKNAHVLDCGCGTGTLLNILRDQRYNLSGSDFSEEALKLTKQKLDCPLFLIDLSKKIKTDKRYDIVICSEILEHIERDDIAIENLRSLLKNNGHLIISVPYLMKNWSEHDVFSGHVRRYESSELEEKLKKYGFSIKESFGWGNFGFKLYYSLLKNIAPKKVMANENLIIKRFVSNLLYYLFILDDFFKSKQDGIRLFIVAQKVDLDSK